MDVRTDDPADLARNRIEDVPISFNRGSSFADRVRVLTPEEWARL